MKCPHTQRSDKLQENTLDNISDYMTGKAEGCCSTEAETGSSNEQAITISIEMTYILSELLFSLVTSH